MSIKRMSLRFNLDKPQDRKAWEYLQSLPHSRNQAIIEAINHSMPESVREIIKATIEECLQNVSLVQPSCDAPVLSEDEDQLLDSLDEFLGG